MNSHEWLTTPGQLDRTFDEEEGRVIPTLERIVIAAIILIAAVAVLFLAGVVHQTRPDFFPAIWQVITTWGGIWPRIG